MYSWHQKHTQKVISHAARYESVKQKDNGIYAKTYFLLPRDISLIDEVVLQRAQPVVRTLTRSMSLDSAAFDGARPVVLRAAEMSTFYWNSEIISAMEKSEVCHSLCYFQKS